MESIDNEAQKFLDINRSLASEIIALQKSIQERREMLQDFDIIENKQAKRSLFEVTFTQLNQVEKALNALYATLDA